MQENKPMLVVGLGNPGNQYVRTRHNVGFIVVDALAGDGGTWRDEHHALVSKGDFDGHKVIFAKPQTFMNDSGTAVSALMSYYKIPLENLIVIHDDMDLSLGDVRTKVGGGSAGHNGIRSVDAAVGNEYRRIRIGIGHARDFGLTMDGADWVLGRFSEDDFKGINSAVEKICQDNLLVQK